MEVDKIVDYLVKINKHKDDPESACIFENKLYKEFVEYVGTTEGRIGDLAQLVLRTKETDFPRWYS